MWFELFQDYFAHLGSFKRHWPPFWRQKAKNHVLLNLEHYKLFQLVLMWFMSVVLIYIYLLVPKIHLSHIVLELYKPKQTKNSTKNEARGSYLQFLLPQHTYTATYMLPMRSIQWGGSFMPTFEVFQEYCELLCSFKRHWSPFWCQKAKNHVLWNLKH